MFLSFPNTPNRSVVNLASTSNSTSDLSQTTTRSASSATDVDGDEVSEDEDDAELPRHRRNPTAPTSSRFQSFLRRARRRVDRAWVVFNDFMTVPLWAAIASLIVACIAPLQHLLEVHAQPIKGSLASAGNCSIPVTLIVLGAYFYHPKEEGAPKKSFYKGMRDKFRGKRNTVTSSPKPTPVMRPGETKTVVIAILSRMVIVPMLLMPLMALSTTYDWQAVFEEWVFVWLLEWNLDTNEAIVRFSPVFVVANVLLISSPPALTLAQVCPKLNIHLLALYSHTIVIIRSHRQPHLVTHSSVSSHVLSSGVIAW